MGEIGWDAVFRLEKYCGLCLTRELVQSGKVRPFEVIETFHNAPLFLGLSEMWERFIAGAVGDPFDSTFAHIAIGNDGRATSQTMTALQGASQFRRPMDASYPQHVDGTTVAADSIVFRSTFAAGEASFDWKEIGIANALTGGLFLNRRPTAYGVKGGSAIWSMGITLRFYGTQGGTIQPPTGGGPGLPGTCFCTPLPGGGGGPALDEIAQYTFSTGTMTPHVVGQHIVRMPGTVTLVDVLSIPDVTSPLTWIVKRAGGTFLTAGISAGDIETTTVNAGGDVASGDVLEFELVDGGGASASTISVLVQARNDRNRQLVFADYNGGSVLVVGTKGEHIIRYGGVIRTADVLAFPAGGTGVTWEVFHNGSSIGTFDSTATPPAAYGSMNIVVQPGDRFQFAINAASTAIGSTMNLTVERS